MTLSKGMIMSKTDYGELRRVLTLDERFEIDRMISNTWIRYLPEYTPSGYHYRAKYIQYAKEFRRAYAKDRKNIRMPRYKLEFIYKCHNHSQMVKARKLREAGYTVRMIDESIGHCLTE